MKERITLSDSTFIEYTRSNDSRIISSSLNVIHNGKIELDDKFFKGLLACLIEVNGKSEGIDEYEIVERAWPPNAKISDSFNYIRNVSNTYKKLKKALASLIGQEATEQLLPKKQRGFNYNICIPNDSITIIQTDHTPDAPTASVQSYASSIDFKTVFDLNFSGLSNLEIAKQLVQNDIRLYGFPENTKEEGSAEKWAAFMTEEPEAWGFLVKDQTEIIGNYSLAILSPEQKNALLNGKLYDGEINLDETYEFSSGRDYTLYILNISINPEYNSIQNRRLLYNKLFELIITLGKEHHLFFKDVYHTSWMFRKTLHSYGFKDILKKDDGSIVVGMSDFVNELHWHNSDVIKELYLGKMNTTIMQR